MYSDRTLTCVDCGASFVFTKEDQEYHAQRGYANEPKRCPDCRRARRSTDSGRPSSASRPTFTAVCADCGQTAQLPFEPRGDRPVYCRTCFARHQPARGRY